MPAEVFIGSVRIVVDESRNQVVSKIEKQLRGQEGSEDDGWLTLTQVEQPPATPPLTRNIRIRPQSISAVAPKDFS